MKEAVEERKERRYKGEDFWDFEGEEKQSGRSFFCWNNESDGEEREDSWMRGLTPGADLHSERGKLLSSLSVHGIGG